LSLKTKVDNLSVVWPQNHWDGFLRFDIKTGGDSFFRFGLKTGGDGFPVWALKPAAMFGDLCLKIIVTVFWFRPQNQTGFSLSVTSQNWQMEDGAGHAWDLALASPESKPH
jgi:hypothetical protein